eukprot:m.109745 g.109745  ORF g.109745 m.109745 type:complete len:136 (+) comp14012_c0_seq1:275-682(+)
MLRCQSLGSGHCFLVLSLWVLNVASNTVSSTSSTSLSTSSTVSSTSTSTSSETSTSTTTSTAAPTQSCFERCGEDFSSNPTASCFCDNACEFYGGKLNRLLYSRIWSYHLSKSSRSFCRIFDLNDGHKHTSLSIN